MRSSKLLLFTLATVLLTPQVLFTNDIENDLDYTQPASSSSGSWMPYIMCAGLSIVVYRQHNRINAIGQRRFETVAKIHDAHAQIDTLAHAIDGEDDPEGGHLPGLREQAQHMQRGLNHLWTVVIQGEANRAGRIIRKPLATYVAENDQALQEHGVQLGRLGRNIEAIHAQQQALSQRLEELAEQRERSAEPVTDALRQLNGEEDSEEDAS
ncbi:hypothetical protein JW872_02760 [Candidatus Babeliales bacterium]|nr:hypothetical protein [Candidatus Babeliales bacterium]